MRSSIVMRQHYAHRSAFDKYKYCIRSLFMALRTAAHYTCVVRGKNLCMARKNPAAVALGSKGGKATAKKLTPEQRAASARRAAQARWAKTKELIHQLVRDVKDLDRTSRVNAQKARGRRKKVS